MTHATTTESNPFNFDTTSTATATESRRLDYTPALISLANTRAQELMIAVSKQPELHTLANKALDGGQPQDLIDLIKAVYDDAAIETDAHVLDECDDNQLSRLLESRRSDRSKSKAKGPRSSVQVCRTYIATMYAELLIRSYWKKPYTGQQGSAAIDFALLANDVEAIGRKVKSLQSKKSRLVKLIAYDEAAKAEFKEIEAEIAQLNSLRPNIRTNTKVTVKDMRIDDLRTMLKDFDASSLPADEQAKLLALMTKLG